MEIIFNFHAMTIRDAYGKIQTAVLDKYGERESHNITRIIFSDIYGINNFMREDIFPGLPEGLNQIIKRLLDSEPVQYITEKSFFFGYEFIVNPAVLIPRPETEELVDLIIRDHQDSNPSILDIGTGSGCIPISLKKKIPDSIIHASDISAAALDIAKKNAIKNQIEIHFYENNILDKSDWGQLPLIDIIVSNPPYIDEKEKNVMEKNVLEWEPHLALFSKEGPLCFYDVISDFALEHLNENGAIYFEINEFHSEGISDILERKHFKNVEIIKDLQQKERIIKAMV